jgi:hypothetical protein
MKHPPHAFDTVCAAAHKPPEPRGIQLIHPGNVSTARTNALIHALDETAWLRWSTMLEPVNLPLGHVLYESGCKLGHVYFPTTAIVSCMCSKMGRPPKLPWSVAKG